jgi:hypothetical protein
MGAVPDKRDRLLQVLREVLLPLLRQRGFEQHELPEPERSRENDFAFPVLSLRRIKIPNLEMLESQPDKPSTAKSVLKFGIVPPEGAFCNSGACLAPYR